MGLGLLEGDMSYSDWPGGRTICDLLIQHMPTTGNKLGPQFAQNHAPISRGGGTTCPGDSNLNPIEPHPGLSPPMPSLWLHELTKSTNKRTSNPLPGLASFNLSNLVAYTRNCHVHGRMALAILQEPSQTNNNDLLHEASQVNVNGGLLRGTNPGPKPTWCHTSDLETCSGERSREEKGRKKGKRVKEGKRGRRKKKRGEKREEQREDTAPKRGAHPANKSLLLPPFNYDKPSPNSPDEVPAEDKPPTTTARVRTEKVKTIARRVDNKIGEAMPLREMAEFHLEETPDLPTDGV